MRYLFNEFEIDTIQFKLFYAEKALAIEPKAFDLLVYLLQNRHRTVTREELFDTVWQRKVVCDTTLSNHINSVRNILGDNGNKQSVIATLRGRGYQFIAKTQEIDNSVSIKPTHKSTQHKRIAVLPFNNVKVDPKTNYLGFAIADQIIGNIANLEELMVRASSSIRKYDMQLIDPVTIGKELHVEYVLTGNYFQLTGFFRLNIELIEVATNNLLWRETIESDAADSFKLPTRIVKNLTKHINGTLKLSN